MSLIEREIVKKEKQLSETDLKLGPESTQDYFSLMKEAQEKLAQRQSGAISDSDFSKFLVGAAAKEKECLRLMDPKVVQRLSDKKYKLMDDLKCLRYSLVRLL